MKIKSKMALLHKRDFMTSPYRSEREKLISIQPWNVRRFFTLLKKLDSFLEADKCYRLADNYLIAMVFTYFCRASLEPQQYTKDYFFAALFLAYNMEEDEGELLLMDLYPFLECSSADIKQLRYELFQRMDYRGAVSRLCCDIVMQSARPESEIWERRRHAYHSGIVSKKYFWGDTVEEICPICNGDCDEDLEEEVVDN